MEKDYYKILGVSVNASEDEIKKEFKKKALIFHPDKNKSPGAEEQFKLVLRAYEVLIDKNKRKEHDMKRNFKNFNPFSNNHRSSRRDRSEFRGRKRDRDNSTNSEESAKKHFHRRSFSEPRSDFNFNFSFLFSPKIDDFFFNRRTFTDNIFSGFPHSSEHSTFGQQNQSMKKDPPTYKDVFVTPEEHAAGCTKKLKVTRKVTGLDGIVRQESKVLSVKIGPFLPTGSQIRFDEEGDEDERDPFKIPADIVITIRTKFSSSTTNLSSPSPSTSSYTSTSTSTAPSPSAPSADVFKGVNLKPELKKGADNLGYSSSSFVQKKALHILVNNPDVNLISISPSRQGKIVAYSLALLNRIELNVNAVQVVVVAPSSEHAIQIGSIIRQVGSLCLGVSISVFPKGQLMVAGSKTSHILVGDPTQIFNWTLHHGSSDFARIKMMILDAAEVQYSQLPEDVFLRIERNIPDNAQRLLFSAVLNHEIMTFAEKIAPNARVIHQH